MVATTTTDSYSGLYYIDWGTPEGTGTGFHYSDEQTTATKRYRAQTSLYKERIEYIIRKRNKALAEVPDNKNKIPFYDKYRRLKYSDILVIPLMFELQLRRCIDLVVKNKRIKQPPIWKKYRN